MAMPIASALAALYSLVTLGAYLISILEISTPFNTSAAISQVWEVIESEEELLSIISIPNDELEELYITKSGARRREKLAVRALLNTVFNDKVYLGHHDNGSPFIQNNPTHISITHTGRFVAIILHPTEDVGIDIEYLDRDFSAAKG